MKKLFYIFITLSLLSLSFSCQKEEIEPNQQQEDIWATDDDQNQEQEEEGEGDNMVTAKVVFSAGYYPTEQAAYDESVKYVHLVEISTNDTTSFWVNGNTWVQSVEKGKYKIGVSGRINSSIFPQSTSYSATLWVDSDNYNLYYGMSPDENYYEEQEYESYYRIID